MKPFMKLTLMMTTIFLLFACSKTVTVPFTADAIGNYVFIGPDTLSSPKCAEPLNAWRAIVDGKGSGTPFGDFTIHFDFCGDTLSNYGNTYAYLVDSSGDSLFLNCFGRVIEGRLDVHPEHVTSYWKDPIEITGGTGLFEGATGSGTTDDYNSNLDSNSHHHWTGTITMLKKKKQ